MEPRTVTFSVDQLLVVERLKTKILRQIIFQKLAINIDDTIDDLLANEVVRKDEPKNKDDARKDEPKSKDEPKKEIESNPDGIKRESVRKTVEKRRFKTYPKSSDEVLTESLGETYSDEIQKLKVDNFGVFSHSEITADIDKLFEELVTSRTYTNIISAVKNKRTFHLAAMDMKEYTAQLKFDVERIKTIFTQKEFEPKKISTIISKVLTPLDYRLLFYEGFEKLHIEPDHIDKLRVTLYNCAPKSTELKCFDDAHFILYFMSYNSIFFDIRTMIETYINCKIPARLKNIIYIDSPSEDPLGFAYYLLTRIEGSGSNYVKYWTLDRRLETLTRDMSQNLKQYMVQMFRKIYKSCYGHNKFVEDFKAKCAALEVDGVLLLTNLFLVVDESRINKMLRDIVKKNATHLATTADKFDKISDDRGQCADFKAIKLTDADKVVLVSSLFDDIEEKRAVVFFSEFA